MIKHHDVSVQLDNDIRSMIYMIMMNAIVNPDSGKLPYYITYK